MALSTSYNIALPAGTADVDKDTFRLWMSAVEADLLQVDGSNAMTGQLLAAPGSAAAPGLAFAGDTNTGIDRSAPDTLSVYTAGFERVKVTSSGTVEIPGLLKSAGALYEQSSFPSFTFQDNSGAANNKRWKTYVGGSGTQFIWGVESDDFATFTTWMQANRSGTTVNWVSFPNGVLYGPSTTSTSAPAYSFGADTNTGVARPAADTLALVTAGLERLRIDSAGFPIFTVPNTTPPSLAANSQVTLTLTSNTNLRFLARGTDDVTRVANLTLA